MNTEPENKPLDGNDAKLPVRCRVDIKQEIAEKWELIYEIKTQIVALVKEEMLLSDDEQWFTEKEEELIVSKRPKKTEKHLVGRINWVQEFKDEDTGESVFINRSQIVRVDGVWR